jgi:uncharacterized membrane protein YbhN (UPF0104 family)
LSARWLKWLGACAAIVGTAFFLASVFATLRWHDLAPRLTLRACTALFLAAACYAATVPLAARAWQLLLDAIGARQPYRRLAAIMLTTQVAKYLPGNVGHLVGRVGLGMRAGIPVAVLAASLLFEIGLLLLTGVLVGVLALLVARASPVSLPGAHLNPVALAAIVAFVVLGIAAAWRRLVPHLGRFLPRSMVADATLRTPGVGTLARVGVFYVLAYLAIGASAAVMARGLDLSPLPGMALLTGAFGIAWVIGFVTPGAPAGVGVREAVLLLLLTPSLGEGDAALLVLALRVATLLGDTLSLVAGLLLLPRPASRAQQEP